MPNKPIINPPFTLADHAQHLGYWVIIRTLILICLGIAVVIFLWDGTVNLPFSEILTALVILTSVNLLTFMRLRKPLPVAQLEFFIQLLVDLACLSAVFYFSGGANNPFVSYFLVPICICAATLSGTYTLAIAGLSVLSYSLLLFFHIPLPILSPHHHQADNSINLHVMGMWLNFFISACLITYFIVKMARDLRAQEAQLNRWREDQLRDEQVMAVATLAAGTAHELGTPLSTMKLLLSELRTEYQQVEPLQNDLKLLQDQVNQCANTLRELVATAEHTKDGQLPSEDIGSYCASLIERWKIMRPDVIARIHLADHNTNKGTNTDIRAQFHPTIAQAIINLLNNAADASPQEIDIEINWDEQKLIWIIKDMGAGIAEEVTAHLGKSFISTKTKGLGIGLLLTQATINRYGGTVSLHNRIPRGTITQLTLPITRGTSIEPNTL
ncbi:ATP-binding protein [Cellvibrio sp. OA-2007]|uniref:ATP-binding protein n=1 Tax=Cellvibrio sp. OA-2007 TaxID=529823 RepID=UPI0007861553|nr:ATP-binding protein [Cellvibrio sp. OA-2007]